MKKQFVGFALMLVIVLALVLSITRYGSSQRNNPDKAPQRSDREKLIKEKVGVPTPIQEGVMTDKQRKHSKIFKRYEGSTGGRKLRDLADETGSVSVVNMVAESKVIRNFDLHVYLTTLTCKANAVVVASVASKTSQLIDEGTFTFTDYEMTVNEVLKNNLAAPLEANQTFTYTGPGGAVELNGRVINAVDYRSEPLQVGEQYLLYLEFIPETGSYKGFSNELDGDTFEIKNGTITQASKKPLPFGPRRTSDAAEFMAAVRLAASPSCDR